MSVRRKRTYCHLPEFKFLVGCLRSLLLSQEDPAGIHGLPWQNLLQLAQRHRVVPAVSDIVSRARPNQLPHEALQTFQAAQSALVENNLRLTSELIRIARAFRDHQLSLLAFKGPVLALQLYGGIERRQFIDLDLLVRPQDLQAALHLLQTRGYRADPSGKDATAEQLLRSMSDAKSFELARYEGAGYHVDLHWRLSNDASYFRAAIEDDFGAAASVKIGGESLQTLDSQTQLRYLAFHGGNHRWMRLSWLYDLAMAVERTTCEELHQVLVEEPSAEIQRYLASGMMLLERLRLLREPCPDALDPMRPQLTGVVDEMYAVLSADEAVPLQSVLADGWWRYKFTGRWRPLLHSATRFCLPKQRDFRHAGPIKPYLSRWRYIAAQTWSRLRSGG